MNFKQTSSNIKSAILLAFILLTSLTSVAQSEIGVLPQVNVDFKIGESWKISSKLEARQLFFQNPAPENEIQYERTDLEFVATRSLNDTKSIGGGYLLRRTEGVFKHRLIQQFSISKKLPAASLSHRFRMDETFEENESTTFRARYRLGFEKPLNGPEIDPKEFYLKLNNEYLGHLQDSETDLEIRALGALGFNFSDKSQLETGIDYRAEELFSSVVTHKIFLNIGWHYSF